MTPEPATYPGYRFPAEIIQQDSKSLPAGSHEVHDPGPGRFARGA
jgi:hypothetical protein